MYAVALPLLVPTDLAFNGIHLPCGLCGPDNSLFVLDSQAVSTHLTLYLLGYQLSGEGSIGADPVCGSKMNHDPQYRLPPRQKT